MKKITLIIFLLGFLLKGFSQQKIKVKKVDNRLLFYKIGKSDTINKNSDNLFFIKIPDSLKHHSRILVHNGRFLPSKNDSVYKLIPINGMKYTHTIYDTVFVVLLEGTYPSSNKVKLQLISSKYEKVLLENEFPVK